MLTPGWFLKELAIIDPTYSVRQTPDGQFFEIVKEVSVTLRLKDGRTAHVHGPRVVDSFKELDSGALEALRKRKAWGRQLNIVEHPMAELKYYADLELEAKKKMEELSLDIISRGMKEIVEIGLKKKQSWSYGGEDGKRSPN